MEVSTIWDRKHCKKWKNCLLQAISPFLTVFHSCISVVHQNAVLSGNGLIPANAIIYHCGKSNYKPVASSSHKLLHVSFSHSIEETEFVLGIAKNIFLLFRKFFLKPPYLKIVKSRYCVS